MESSDMKNMVVLKNLPSNMVEEAIIIFKETQRVKEKEVIDKSNKITFEEVQPKSKEYILKEAEMLVTDYINRIENKTKLTNGEIKIKMKYKKLRRYSIFSTVLFVISLILNFI